MEQIYTDVQYAGTAPLTPTPKTNLYGSLVSRVTTTPNTMITLNAGAEILRDFNAKIPEIHILDFNKLVTAIYERKQKIGNINKEKANCFNIFVKVFAQTIKAAFEKQRQAGIDSNILQNYRLPITYKFVKVYQNDFDYEKGTINANAHQLIKDEITEECRIFKDKKDREIKNYENEIAYIQEVINTYIFLFKIKTDKQIQMIYEDFSTILQNIMMQEITIQEVVKIKEKIDDIKKKAVESGEQKMTPEPVMTRASSVTKGLSNVSSNLSNLSKMYTPPIFGIKRGGKTTNYKKYKNKKYKKYKKTKRNARR